MDDVWWDALGLLALASSTACHAWHLRAASPFDSSVVASWAIMDSWLLPTTTLLIPGILARGCDGAFHHSGRFP